jgi:hypothetical protein
MCLQICVIPLPCLRELSRSLLVAVWSHFPSFPPVGSCADKNSDATIIVYICQVFDDDRVACVFVFAIAFVWLSVPFVMCCDAIFGFGHLPRLCLVILFSSICV